MMSSFYERYWSVRNRGGEYCLQWRRFHDNFPGDKEVTVVDFGCGKGRIIEEMQKRNSFARYIGLDVSTLAIEEASKLIPTADFYRIEDGGKFPLEDNSIDFIMASEVIEHVYDIEKAFSEIYRVMKPHGRIFLTTPYHGLIKNILIVLFFFNRHFDPTGAHVRFFTKKTLFSCLKIAGLHPLEHGYFGRFYPIPKSIYILAEKI